MTLTNGVMMINTALIIGINYNLLYIHKKITVNMCKGLKCLIHGLP